MARHRRVARHRRPRSEPAAQGHHRGGSRENDGRERRSRRGRASLEGSPGIAGRDGTIRARAADDWYQQRRGIALRRGHAGRYSRFVHRVGAPVVARRLRREPGRCRSRPGDLQGFELHRSEPVDCGAKQRGGAYFSQSVLLLAPHSARARARRLSRFRNPQRLRFVATVAIRRLTSSSRGSSEASRLHVCWMAFARTGVPQGPDVPTWPRYQPAQDELLDFDVTTTVRTVPDRAALTLLQKRVVP